MYFYKSNNWACQADPLMNPSCQSSSGCTVPQTRTGGCRRRSRSTRCSATPWVTPARAERLAPSWAAAAAAPAASTWTASTASCRRTSSIWKAARMATRTECDRGQKLTKRQKCSRYSHISEARWPAEATLTFQKLLKLAPWTSSFCRFPSSPLFCFQPGLVQHLAFHRNDLTHIWSLPWIYFPRFCFKSV